MKFNVKGHDNQTKVVLTVIAESEAEAIEMFKKEFAWNKEMIIDKAYGPLGRPKAGKINPVLN